jgi:hypothetical protein
MPSRIVKRAVDGRHQGKPRLQTVVSAAVFFAPNGLQL